MSKPLSVPEIVSTANALVRDVIAETGRIVNTPTQEWTVYARQAATRVLSTKAAAAYAVFDNWIEQNIWLNNMGKICGSLDAIQRQSRYCSTSKSRFSGRADLKQALQELVEGFGDGCEYQASVGIDEPESTIKAGVLSTSDAKNGSSRVDPEERPYSIKELTVLHNLSRRTVIRLYENEPGVLVLQSSPTRQRQTGRRRRTIRVPRHVYLRVRRRLEVR